MCENNDFISYIKHICNIIITRANTLYLISLIQQIQQNQNIINYKLFKFITKKQFILTLENFKNK